MSVRPAHASDAASVATVYIESWNAGFGDLIGMKEARGDEAARAAIGRSDQRWRVAERSGDVVGFAGIGDGRDPEGLGELHTIAVASSMWSAGVGTALMDVVLPALRAQYGEAILWTVAGYERGRRFYEVTGWRADGATRRGGAEVRFRQRLG